MDNRERKASSRHTVLVRARQIPDELEHALRKARVVELAADRHDQRLAAIAASTNLLRAAVEAGWRVSELAPVMGLKAVTARKRIAGARRVRPVSAGGLTVPAPARKVTIGDYLRLPVEQRDWLTFGEACALTGLSTNGLRNWRLAGLLPNTRWVHPKKGLYLRSDLSRVLAAPPYNNRGHSHAAARQLITAANDTANRHPSSAAF